MSKYRKLMVLVALIAALTMLATMTGVSFAAGGGTTDGEEEMTCVIGYVINHRELVVDGTKFDPQLSVMYEASSDAAQTVAPLEAAGVVTATASVTATAVVTTEVEAMQVSSAQSVTVNNKGYFSIPDLTVGDWNFMMQLPADWAGIVPEADRGALAETGSTYLEERDSKHCHVVVFKGCRRRWPQPPRRCPA